MSPASRRRSRLDALNDIDVGDTIECTLEIGVRYRTEPRLAAQTNEMKCVNDGEQIIVQEREGDWVRDEHGWLPLKMKDTPAFTKRVDLGRPLCGVFTNAPGS